MEFTEVDLVAVTKIQELKNCTTAKAKEIYRRAVLKLANPDVDGRDQIILEGVQSAPIVATDEEVEEAVSKPKKMTRNERRLAKKEKKEAKAKAPKKARKAPAKSGTPRIEHPLATLEREVVLTPVGDPKHVYTANLFGKKHVTIWVERNRSTGAEARFQSINVSQSQLDAAKKYAKTEELPIGVCVGVRVLSKLDQGYAVPLAIYEKFKIGEAGFNLSGAARQTYEQEGWAGVKLIEKAPDAEAA